mgnify:CR=1 FL=1
MDNSILINNVQIFDGSNEQTSRGNVLVVNSRIKAVSENPIPTDGISNLTILDGKGKFLMPGLIDAHWHAYMSCNTMMDLLTADTAYTQFKAGQEAQATLLRGFTAIRDAGGPVFGLKRAIDEPRPFDCCGLTHTEEIGAALIADGIDAVTVAARNNLRLGASQIKLMTGGGVASLYDRLEDTQFFEEEIHAAVKAAEDAGTYVMVHVYVPRAIQRAIRAGVKSIEHGHLIDEPTMQLIAEKEIWLSMQPFTLGDNQFPTKEQQEKHALVVQGTDQTYQLAKKYNVKLAWGTDLLFNPANTKNQNQGILKLRQWFSNFEILKMVTHDNAELLALSGARNPYPGKLGVIEEDAWADLILVDGDVLKDITLLGNPEKNFIMIMKGGEIYKNRV